MSATATNLRDAPSSFVGRAAEVEDLSRSFERGARWITVTGPGGMGKTRLAIRFAQSQLRVYAAHGGGGVWFCDLTEARTVTGLIAIVAGVLGIRLADTSRESDAVEALAPALARRGRMLLVLDNFEHLTEVGGCLLDSWLAAAPAVDLLVTSRAAVGRPSEQVKPLAPLRQDDAMALFLGRARQVRPDLNPSDRERAVVADIVRSLEGMPLAIELAVSRMSILSPDQLRARLERPLEVLDARATEGKHGSVRRTVLDSVRLLGPDERTAFAACAIFRDGFDLEAVEAVIGDPAALVAIEALVRHSLLRASPSSGGSGDLRFSFFETIREVAAGLLDEMDERDAIVARHSAHYASLAARLGVSATNHGGGPEFVRLSRELENAVDAHSHAVGLARRNPDGPGAARALSVALGLEPVLSARGLSGLRRRLLEEAIALRPRHAWSAELAEALLALGLARRELGAMDEARATFEDALQHATRADAPALAALAHVRIGEVIEVAGGTAEAHGRFERALALLADSPLDASRELREAEAYMRVAHAYRREGVLDRAEAAIGEAMARYRRLEHEDGLGAALYEAAVIAMFQGRRRSSLARFDEGLVLAQRADARATVGALTTARGGLLQEMGRLEEALVHHADAARVFHELGSRYRETSALYYLATTYLERGDAKEAEHLLARASDRVRGVGSPRYEALIESCRAVTLARLGDASAGDAALRRAERALASCATEPALATTIAIHRLTLSVCLGHPEKGAAGRARALAKLHPSDDSRFARRMLASVLKPRRAAPLPELQVSEGAKSFRAPGASAAVDLSRRATLRRILAFLVHKRLDAPGEAVSVDDVVRAGWPGERIRAEAALNRAYVALTHLRNLGLREVLVTGSGGYWLSPAVAVTGSPSLAPSPAGATEARRRRPR